LENTKITKVIRDGKVAVLISVGSGLGWSTGIDNIPNSEDLNVRELKERLLFDPKLVEIVENGRTAEITLEWKEENLGICDFTGETNNLKIIWLEQGTEFYVSNYEGYETLITSKDFFIA